MILSDHVKNHQYQFFILFPNILIRWNWDVIKWAIGVTRAWTLLTDLEFVEFLAKFVGNTELARPPKPYPN
jgi:hypothetical protein